MQTSPQPPLALAITGASGAIYGLALLRVLHEAGFPPYLAVSRGAWRTIALETAMTPEAIKSLALACYEDDDISAPLASGSFPLTGMIVAPCSVKSLSAIANSYNHNLIVRAADCCLKERRPLLLLVRETPLHQGHLRLMLKAARLGAIIMPPAPAFYHRPRTIQDLVDHTVGKMLDQFQIPHNLYTPWGKKSA
jgi:4-hydroxy-3-polyprenylbenzoate decarboxylase